MKYIIAIIRETQLEQVRQALIEAKITRITVSRVSGHGRQVSEEIYRGMKFVPDLIPKVKLEIAVNDEYVTPTIDAISAGARSGEKDDGIIGDGKIFVLPMEDCIRIRTGERGSSAI